MKRSQKKIQQGLESGGIVLLENMVVVKTKHNFLADNHKISKASVIDVRSTDVYAFRGKL